MDESSLHVANTCAVSGKKSHVIDLEDDVMPNVIPIVRTASDGKHRRTYTLRVHKADDTVVYTPRGQGDMYMEKPVEEQEQAGVEGPDVRSQFSLEGLDVTGLKLSGAVLAVF